MALLSMQLNSLVCSFIIAYVYGCQQLKQQTKRSFNPPIHRGDGCQLWPRFHCLFSVSGFAKVCKLPIFLSSLYSYFKRHFSTKDQHLDGSHVAHSGKLFDISYLSASADTFIFCNL